MDYPPEDFVGSDSDQENAVELISVYSDLGRLAVRTQTSRNTRSHGIIVSSRYTVSRFVDEPRSKEGGGRDDVPPPIQARPSFFHGLDGGGGGDAAPTNQFRSLFDGSEGRGGGGRADALSLSKLALDSDDSSSRSPQRTSSGYSSTSQASSPIPSSFLDLHPTVSLMKQQYPLPMSPLAQKQPGYEAVARPAPAIRAGKKSVKVISNVWQLEYEDRLVHCYDVSVGLESIGNDGSTRMYSLNKGPRDDASVHERNEMIRAALKTGLIMYRVLSESGWIASDGAAMMFTNESLDGELKKHDYKLTVPVENLPAETRQLIRNAGVKHAIIEIVAAKRFRVKDLSGMTNIDRSDIDASVKQFFEVLTSEDALSSHMFTFFTGGKLYLNDVNPQKIGCGQERRKGMFKGFSLAEDKEGRVIGALNIDVTTGTFWTKGRLLQTICEINKWADPAAAKWDAAAIKRTNELIKNLRVAYTSADGVCSFDFVASGITAKTWSSMDGQTYTEVRTIAELVRKVKATGLHEPLAKKFPIDGLKLANWPLIESRRARRRTDNPEKFEVITEHFPIEMLEVKPHQRVPLKKQGADPERAMPVADRWNQTRLALDALNLFGDAAPRANEAMQAFGIRVARAPLETRGIVRAMPGVTFNSNRGAAVDAKTSFRTGGLAYLVPATISTLVIAVSGNLAPRVFDPAAFTRAVLAAARAKGIKIEAHTNEIVTPQQLHDRLHKINKDRKAGDEKLKKVIFLYVEPEASHHHDELKLFERRFCVVTQHLTAENATKMINNKPTMENVLMKLNIKGGGHNCNVTPEKFAEDLWMHKKTLIMGYDVWHPTGQTRHEKMADCLPDPSVVGFSFNGGVNADSFIGDYHYQQATKERVHDSVLNARIKWMLLSFEKSRGVLPPLIIVIRDGISDGQYRHGMDELMALREGATEYAASGDRSDKLNKEPIHGYDPKFIFVIATKRHHKRMYCADRGRPENMPAMSVVDDTITNPVLFEFLMQSHTPLQGMAKATKYTVLKDDVGTTADAMQSLMGALCFEHQVSCNAISIPEPVYQSDEWAKRGAANMRMFKMIYGEQGQFQTGFTYEELTRRLSYWECDLGKTRVNA